MVWPRNFKEFWGGDFWWGGFKKMLREINPKHAGKKNAWREAVLCLIRKCLHEGLIFCEPLPLLLNLFHNKSKPLAFPEIILPSLHIHSSWWPFLYQQITDRWAADPGILPVLGKQLSLQIPILQQLIQSFTDVKRIAHGHLAPQKKIELRTQRPRPGHHESTPPWHGWFAHDVDIKIPGTCDTKRLKGGGTASSGIAK